MNPIQGLAFDNEIALAKEFIARGELETGFAHIERAHVIGQAFVLPHAKSHWLIQGGVSAKAAYSGLRASRTHRAWHLGFCRRGCPCR
jgi:Protein of unknown function (DUF3703)